MDALDTSIYVTCSGYTGEDGFELSIPNDKAALFADWLLAQPEVAPIGLGARDSLRLEAGLCLYGHELTPEISPIEAGLRWAIAPARRPDGARAGGLSRRRRIGGADGWWHGAFAGWFWLLKANALYARVSR